MRKLLLTLAVLCGTVSGWAQSAVMPTVSDAPTNEGWAANTTWYTIKTGGGHYLKSNVKDEDGNLKLTNTEWSDAAEALWCIVGNGNDGYQFYNKAKGTTFVLGTTGSEDRARASFVDKTAVGANTINYFFQASNKSGYWCVRMNSEGNNYWNNRDGYLALWNNSSAVTGWNNKGDDGSALFFEAVMDYAEVEDISDLSNTKAYFLRSSRGNIIYNSGTPNQLASSVYYKSISCVSEAAQWAIYKHNDKYYFYNLAAKKFIGQEKKEGAVVPLTKRPFFDVQIVNSTKNGYPFIMSTDNYGTINHYDHQKAPGIANWRGEYYGGSITQTADDGSAHKIMEVRDLTEEEIAAIEATFETVKLPQSGTEYVLYDAVHKVFLDINNPAVAPDQAECTELAKLNSEKQSLYITPTNFSWKIHTESVGGKYLGQYTNANQWNSRVHNDLGSFSWDARPIEEGDEVFYALENISGTENGYLGTTKHADSQALFVNQGAGSNQLKLKLWEATLVYKVEATHGIGTVLYNGTRYVNGDYIFADEEITAEDVTLIDVIGYTHTVSVENNVISAIYNQEFDPNNLKVLLKNKQHKRFLGVNFVGGELDNDPVPTTHRFSGNSESDYRNCWELQLTTYESNGSSLPCFVLYNSYYDWYAGKIAERNTPIDVVKSIDDAGRFDVDCVEETVDNETVKVLTFRCLNKTTTNEYWYLHMVNWSNYGVVDWNYDADASKWYMTEVTDEMIADWNDQVKLDMALFKEYCDAMVRPGIGYYGGLTDEQINIIKNIEVGDEDIDINKARECLYAMYYQHLIVLNKPTVGFYYIKSMNGDDPKKKGKYIQLKADLSGLEEVAEATSKSIIYINENNNLLHYTIGRYQNGYAAPAVVGYTADTWQISENPKVKGAYSLKSSSVSNWLSDWGGIGGGQNSTYEAWTFEPVEELPITISSAGYATFYCPVAVTLPEEGLKAYYVSSTENGKAQMTDIEKVIPANTGVILEGAEGPYNLTIAGEAESVTNKLSGTVASEYISTPSYVLSAQGTPAVVGFYQAMLNFTVADNGTGTKVTEGGTHFLNNGFRAYLPAGENNARSLVFDFGGTETGIDELKGENGNVKAEVYDLAGRRVLNAKKGVFVVNGKVIVK